MSSVTEKNSAGSSTSAVMAVSVGKRQRGKGGESEMDAHSPFGRFRPRHSVSTFASSASARSLCTIRQFLRSVRRAKSEADLRGSGPERTATRRDCWH